MAEEWNFLVREKIDSNYYYYTYIKYFSIIFKLISGATAQGEVTADKKDFLDWTDSTKFEVHIESKLGSFNETLPQQVMDVYNVSDHWQEYASMISDIRTVCPLQELADYASKNFVANVFSYVATQPKLDSMDGIADRTVDVSAIFGMYKILPIT